MKKFTLFFFLLQMTFFVMAQSEPAWVDSDQRRAFYPDGTYFTGYSEGQRVGSESVERATKRIKDAARVEAVSTIQVHVKNSTQNQALSQTLRTMEGTFRQSTRQFASHTQTSVDVEIPGLQVDAWTNPSTGMISAFAYVKKASLIRQLEKKITVLLTKIETTLDQIDQLCPSMRTTHRDRPYTTADHDTGATPPPSRHATHQHRGTDHLLCRQVLLQDTPRHREVHRASTPQP